MPVSKSVQTDSFPYAQPEYCFQTNPMNTHIQKKALSALEQPKEKAYKQKKAELNTSVPGLE